jgi:YVTN family beta-propeller protein
MLTAATCRRSVATLAAALAFSMTSTRLLAAPFVALPIAKSNEVALLDTADRSVKAVVDAGAHLRWAAANSQGTLLYTTYIGSPAIKVVNVDTREVVTLLTIDGVASAVVTNPTGTLLYVTNVNRNKLEVIHVAEKRVVASIPVGRQPLGVAANREGTRLYVANSLDDSLSVIDTRTLTVTGTVAVGNNPVAVAAHPTRNIAYVANQVGNSVSAVDVDKNVVLAETPVGMNPIDLAVEASGKSLYVANAGSSSIVIVDTEINKLKGLSRHVPSGVLEKTTHRAQALAYGASEKLPIPMAERAMRYGGGAFAIVVLLGIAIWAVRRVMAVYRPAEPDYS